MKKSARTRTSKRAGDIDWKAVDSIIKAGLVEDAVDADVTSQAIFSPRDQGLAVYRAKQAGVIAGLPVAARVFYHLNRTCTFTPRVVDGATVAKGTVIAEISGSVRALLAGERLSLNLLQRMSGIASLTRTYVDALQGLSTVVLDTRKTAPGLRYLDKLAVRTGGGTNHRMNLADLAMIKDNHRERAGGIRQAVERVRAKAPGIRIEVETANLAQVQEALDAGVDIIMLDNMSTAMMRKAVRLIAGRAKVEASGGIALAQVRAIARTGVDYISIGRLTHSAPALDLSMKIST